MAIAEEGSNPRPAPSQATLQAVHHRHIICCLAYLYSMQGFGYSFAGQDLLLLASVFTVDGLRLHFLRSLFSHLLLSFGPRTESSRTLFYDVLALQNKIF